MGVRRGQFLCANKFHNSWANPVFSRRGSTILLGAYSQKVVLGLILQRNISCRTSYCTPLLFNIYVNSLVEEIETADIGVDVGMSKLSMLLYADDIVLVSKSQDKLQKGLNVLYDWCQTQQMSVNVEKSKIDHFRKGPSITRCEGPLKYGQLEIEIVSQYKYLGLTLTEFLDYQVTAKKGICSCP